MTKKLTIILIPIAVIIIACIGVLLYFGLAPSGNTVYVEHISSAQKAYSSGDFENAIMYYNLAIEDDATQEEPYIQIARIYHDDIKDIEKAIAILQQGYEATKSEKLNTLLIEYLGLSGADSSESVLEKTVVTEEAKFNNYNIKIASTYTYKQYKDSFTVSSESKDRGIYKVRFSQLNAELTFANSPENEILNSSTGIPKDDVRPTAIIFNDVNDIIIGATSGITINQLRGMGVNNLNVHYDNSLEKNVADFTYSSCSFSVECIDENTIKGTDIYNVVVPPQNITDNKVKVYGEIIDVTTAKKVNEAKVTAVIAKYAHTCADNASFEAQCAQGEYSVSLDPGEYVFLVEAPGYILEEYEVTVNNAGVDQEENFSISPKLGADKIRIVLEWGENPRDLDSHLEGENGDGVTVNVSWLNRRAVSSGKTLAELDVDDQQGYGPETITINDTSGEYKYSVHRYAGTGSIQSSGVTVKVYEGSSSQPTIITVPSSQSGDWWEVLTIKNGKITDINGIEN